MTDNPKADGKQFMFSLVRLRPECKISPTFADFTPLFSSAVSTGSIIPIFNDDHCYFTHGFSLLSDKKTQAKVAESEKLYFEHRVRQSIQSSASAIIEELAPSSNYCQICQQIFKNYDQHLEQKTHILRCQHNQFNDDIKELCHLIDESETDLSTCSKRKFIKKREKREERSSAIKSSPKTTVDNDPKRKLSQSYQEASFSTQYLKESFNL